MKITAAENRIKIIGDGCEIHVSRHLNTVITISFLELDRFQIHITRNYITKYSTYDSNGCIEYRSDAGKNDITVFFSTSEGEKQ